MGDSKVRKVEETITMMKEWRRRKRKRDYHDTVPGVVSGLMDLKKKRIDSWS